MAGCICEWSDWCWSTSITGSFSSPPTQHRPELTVQVQADFCQLCISDSGPSECEVWVKVIRRLPLQMLPSAIHLFKYMHVWLHVIKFPPTWVNNLSLSSNNYTIPSANPAKVDLTNTLDHPADLYTGRKWLNRHAYHTWNFFYQNLQTCGFFLCGEISLCPGKSDLGGLIEVLDGYLYGHE